MVKIIKTLSPLKALLLLVVIVILGYLVIGHFHKAELPKDVIPSSSPAKTLPISNAPSTNAADKTVTDSSKQAPSASADTSSSAVLVAPYGDFVSTHQPSLSTSSSEYSVCNTTPSASCHIEFSKGGTTRRLADQIADRSGSTYWSWDLKDADLSAGVWSIKAVASLNGKTLSATDSRPLEVQP